MNPLGAALILTFCILVFVLPRWAAAVTIIASVCYITQGQELNLGFHFTAIRLVLLAAMVRGAARGEFKQIPPNRIDRAVLIYAVGIMVIASVRAGTSEEFVYRMGWLYNILFSYFAFRALVRDREDLRRILRGTALVLIPFAVLLVRESLTNSNFFEIFGGVSFSSMVRDGHVRSQGSFRSPITAGSFGATFAMLYAGALFARWPGARLSALLGLIVSLTIMICAHSSGPMLGFALGLLALMVWRIRPHTRKIRWGIVFTLIGLQMVMKAPVWFLLARAGDIVGGGGYHRSELIDQFVNSFSSWWLGGMDVTATAVWFPYNLSSDVGGGSDITNQFVLDGVNGGLIGIGLSILVIVRCCQAIGKTLDAYGSQSEIETRLVWGLGATLVASIGILFSVSYFDQMNVIWYFLLAAIAGVTESSGDPAPAAGSPTGDHPNGLAVPFGNDQEATSGP